MDYSDDRSRSQPGTARNWIRGESQIWAETVSAVAPQYPYQSQNQDRQLHLETQNNHQEGSSIYREYRHEGSHRHDAMPRVEGENTQAYQQSCQWQNPDKEVSVEWEDSRPPRRRQGEGYRQSQYESKTTVPEAKLPPFSGKEEWRVWVSRFEAVAERRRWDEDAKLDNLLPRL